MNTNHISTLVNQLSQFNRPSDFIAIVRKSARVPNERFFNDPAFKPLQEAWAAGHFALGLEQVYPLIEVQLDPDRFPDFHLRIRGSEYEFEFTTADKPEREIGREYKDRKNNPLKPGSRYEPGRGQDEGPVWIADAVKKKYEKRYSRHPHLLVYANFDAESLDPSAVAGFCHPWSSSFKSIWVLWAYQYLQLYDSDVFGKTDMIWHRVGVNPWS